MLARTGIWLKDSDLGYIAGIIDGEGCIYISGVNSKARQKRYHRVGLKVSSTDECLVRWLGEKLGSTHYEETHRDNPKWKDSWTWHLIGTPLLPILEATQPLMVIKKYQTQIAIEALKTYGRQNQNNYDDIFPIREQLRLELSNAKHGKLYARTSTADTRDS